MAFISFVGGGLVGNLCTDTSSFHYVTSHLNSGNVKVMQAIVPVLGSASALATYNIMGRTVEQKVIGTATLLFIFSLEGMIFGMARSHQDPFYHHLSMSLIGPTIGGIAAGAIARSVDNRLRA